MAFLEGPPDTAVQCQLPLLTTPQALQDRAKSLERIARDLEGMLVNITYEGSERIIAEHERRVAEIEALRARDRQINSQESLPDQARLKGGKIYTFGNGTAYIRDAADGALISSHGPFAAGVGISGRMLFDESATTFYMTGTSAVHQVIAHRAIPGSMPLAELVSALCLRTGLTEADLDVTELTDGVRGYALARQVSVRGALEMLAAAYTFDAVESDHQLKFKMRGRSPSRVIAEKDLVPVNAERETFIETRAQEVGLPLRFTVVYQDLERDADVGTQ